MPDLVNLPDSFENWGEAEAHLMACLELMGKKVSFTQEQPPEYRVFKICAILEHSFFDIQLRIRKGQGR